ncbi:MAG: DUF697 domain-containing protein [Alistipes sp.]|nr:DUF697 domain-containing protein [Alistipes sp.]
MKKKSLSECDAEADRAIRVMVGALVGGAVVPVAINWAIAAAAYGSGAVAIGKAYGVTMSDDEGWKLVKQFFLAAGFGFLSLNIGAKVIACIAQATGIGYFGGAVIDAAISGAAAYAIGGCAKAYFRQDYLGKKNKLSKEELGRIFRDEFNKHKNDKRN